MRIHTYIKIHIYRFIRMYDNNDEIISMITVIDRIIDVL